MRRFRFCQHTKDNGEGCGSPAMRGKHYCYFHLEVVSRRRRLARMARTRQLLAEAKLYDDRILALNSRAKNILTPYARVNAQPPVICTQEGEGATRREPSLPRASCPDQPSPPAGCRQTWDKPAEAQVSVQTMDANLGHKLGPLGTRAWVETS